MAGVAGDRIARLRSLARPAAVVLVACLVIAAITYGALGRAHPSAVTLRAGGHAPPAVVASGNGAALLAPSVPSSSGVAASGPATTGDPVAAGGGDTGQVASPTDDAPTAGVQRHTTAPRNASPAGPSQTPSPPPARPAPSPPPQPPGLGARLLPGLPPVAQIPGSLRSRPPSSGPKRYPSGSTGYDISWPQCGQTYPPRPYTIAIVGVNDGQAFSTNPCLGSEASWAGSGRNLYMNINSPSSIDGTDQSGPAGNCAPGNKACLAYNYGYNAAANSVAAAANEGVSAGTWWLDVETAGQCSGQFPTNGTGYWSCDTVLNSRTIQGAIDSLRHDGLFPGDYSTSYQWGVITGGYVPTGGSVPNWIAGADPSQTSSWCSGSHDFGGGDPWLIQLAESGLYDRDQAC